MQHSVINYSYCGVRFVFLIFKKPIICFLMNSHYSPIGLLFFPKFLRELSAAPPPPFVFIPHLSHLPSASSLSETALSEQSHFVLALFCPLWCLRH